MEGSLAYPPPPPSTGGVSVVPSVHQPSSFGIDNILTGMNNGAGTIGGGHYTAGYGPGPLQANHSNGDATSSMIMRKIDAAGMNNDHKRESISSMEDDDDGFRKKKKPRTAFSREQVAELEKKFTEKKYLSSAERGELAEKLKLSDMQVKTWFQNRRMKYKRQTEEAEMELKSPKYPYTPFVPYTSIYSYMPYKATTDFTTNNNNSGANGPGAPASVYHSSTTSHIHSCSQQYNTVSPGTTSPTSETAAAGFNNGSNPTGAGAGGYPNNTTPPMMSPRYSPNQQQSHCSNFNGFFNRGGISPLSPPSTPNVSGGGNGYSGNYFSGSYVGTAHYSE